MKRGSFFARMYGKAGGRLPPLRKRYYNQMTVGADSIPPALCVNDAEYNTHRTAADMGIWVACNP